MTKLRLYDPEVLAPETSSPRVTDTPVAQPPAQQPQQWRSINQLENPESLESEHEFAEGTTDPLEWDDEKLGVQRRDMLKLMGASLALAGAGTACVRRPEEHIVPYTRQPENVIPGVPDWYASALPSPWGAQGILVESHEGRPTKIEGNPDHPESRGKADVSAHAQILQLYDPDRTRSKTDKGDAWTDWDAGLSGIKSKLIPAGGEGFGILLDNAEGPTRERLLKDLKGRYPGLRTYHYDALAADNGLLGAEMVFGAGTRVHHDLSRADVIFSADADFLNSGPEHLAHARGFAAGRSFERVPSAADANKMNRLYVAESTFSTTGTNADHRVRVASADVIELMKALAAELLGSKHNLSLPASMGDKADLSSLSGKPKLSNAKFIPALAKDLARNRKRAVIVVGERQPAAVHALANVLNAALGAFEDGGPSRLTRRFPGKEDSADEGTLAAHRSSHAELVKLIRDVEGGTVKSLLILGPNPVYTAPKALKLTEAIKKLSFSVHVGLYKDETAALCKMHLPMAHPLETWGDALAWDGTLTVQQPLIEALHGGRSAIEVIGQLAGESDHDGRALVRGTLAAAPGSHSVSETRWRKILHDGITGRPHRERLSVDELAQEDAPANVAGALSKTAAQADGIELVIDHCPKIYDGRFANLSWCQELPDPVSKLTWENALYVGTELARKLGIESSVRTNNYTADLVTVTTPAGTVTAPAFVTPGIATNTVLMHRGYGRTHGGHVANGLGVDVSGLLPADGSVIVGGVKIARTGATAILATTQDHFAMHGTGLKSVLEHSDSFGDDLYPLQKRKSLTGTGARPHALTVDKADYQKNPEGIRQRTAMPGGLVELKRLSKAGAERRHKEHHKFKVGAQDTDHPSRPIGGMQMANMDVTEEAWSYDRQAWGMTIDLSACIGCNACTIACQSENNIPSVGKESVLFGREMHWIRVDRYFEGDVDEPASVTQPVPCMHCENAPCEPVCPFAATIHDEEGLNAMVYNRCAGTRYCLNNCPYKVRRFNYFDYTKTAHLYVEEIEKERHELLEMARNPNVTVRFRGVMEKCTYCTQRIQSAKFAAKRNGADHNNLPDGAITPACAQTCPTNAITFGNVNDAESEVSKRKVADRQYEVLSELNNRPRTTYLAKLRNPNPELVG